MTAEFEPAGPELIAAIEEAFADSDITAFHTREITIRDVVYSAYETFADTLAHELGIRPRVEGDLR